MSSVITVAWTGPLWPVQGAACPGRALVGENLPDIEAPLDNTNEMSYCFTEMALKMMTFPRSTYCRV